jgi:isopenicillin N synthase-like dioxygenase
LEHNQTRLGEHSDYGTISFLFQDSVGGLEIEVKDKGFIQATPIPGTILVIAANLLQRWSADSVPSLVHRVMIPDDEKTKRKARQSTVFFLLPDHDYLVKPMDGSTKYKPITCLEYLQPIIEGIAGVTY